MRRFTARRAASKADQSCDHQQPDTEKNRTHSSHGDFSFLTALGTTHSPAFYPRLTMGTLHKVAIRAPLVYCFNFPSL